MTHSHSFASLRLKPEILNNLQSLGYEHPSPIQEKSIPLLLDGRDLVGQARTGTGKTAAFALPILQKLDLSRKSVQALILTPTRELGIQVAESFRKYSANMNGLRVVALYGGQDIRPQLKELKTAPQVVVGTPGRIMDHLERGTLSLGALVTLVLDEADEMLRMGFIDDVEWILDHAPRERQTVLFSATMPASIRKVAAKHLHNPAEVKIESGEGVTSSKIRQHFRILDNSQKLEALLRVLELEHLEGCIIFVRTRAQTMEIADKLQGLGHSCAALSGDIKQAERERIIRNLKSGKLKVVVATDVAARGLDVSRITHVVNYDIPLDSESYVHRIGRTGRAGREGDAILFATKREMGMVKRLEKFTGLPMAPLTLPSREEVVASRLSRFRDRIVNLATHVDLSLYADPLDRLIESAGVSNKNLYTLLLYMAQSSSPLIPDVPFTLPVHASFETGGKQGKIPSSSATRRGKSAGIHTRSRKHTRQKKHR